MVMIVLGTTLDIYLTFGRIQGSILMERTDGKKKSDHPGSYLSSPETIPQKTKKNEKEVSRMKVLRQGVS